MTDLKIRILIADDHAVVREGLRAFIAMEPDMDVVGEAGDGVEVVDAARGLSPDVILLDIVMPRRTGLEALDALRAEDCPARVIVLTSFAEQDQIYPAIKAGAVGYLLKDSSPDQLVQAIRDVHHGQTSLHPSIARKLIENRVGFGYQLNTGDGQQGSSIPGTNNL